MPTCTEVADCTADAVVQYSSDCESCEDVAAEHRAAEAEATRLYTEALERHAAAEQARDAAAIAGDNITFTAAVGQMDAAGTIVAAYGNAARVAAVRAAEHEGPHTHPVFACAEHAPADWHEAVWNEA